MSEPMLNLRHISITDPFWFRVRETARREGIPYQWKALNDEIPGAEPSRCMRNFRIAAGKCRESTPVMFSRTVISPSGSKAPLGPSADIRIPNLKKSLTAPLTK